MSESPGGSVTSSIMSEFRNNLKKQRLAASTPPPSTSPSSSPNPIAPVSAPLLSAASSITNMFGASKEEVIPKKRASRRSEGGSPRSRAPTLAKDEGKVGAVNKEDTVATEAVKDDDQNVILAAPGPLSIATPSSPPEPITAPQPIAPDVEGDGWDLDANEEEDNAPSTIIEMEDAVVEMSSEAPKTDDIVLTPVAVIEDADSASIISSPSEPLAEATLQAESDSPALLAPAPTIGITLEMEPEIPSIIPILPIAELEELLPSVDSIESPPAPTLHIEESPTNTPMTAKHMSHPLGDDLAEPTPGEAIQSEEEVPSTVIDALPRADESTSLQIKRSIIEEAATDASLESNLVDGEVEPDIVCEAKLSPKVQLVSSTPKDPRLAEMTTAYKRLQGLKTSLDRIVSELLPVVSTVSDLESFERELKNLLSKSEMSMGEVGRLSGEALLHKERLQEIRDTHRLEAKSQSSLIDSLKAQVEQKETGLKLVMNKLAASEETTKLAEAATLTSREAHEKTKIVAKEEEEKRIKALSLLRALRQKLVKSDKDRDEANAMADQLRLTGATASDQIRTEQVKHERDIGQQRMAHDAQLVKLRNSFDRETNALRMQYDKETSTRKSQFELEVITARASHAKEISSRQSRIHQLEGTVKELTVSRDSTFDSLQLKTAESESALDHSRSSQMQLVELRYSMKELEDRLAASREESEEIKRNQKDSTRDDTHLRRSLAEAEARSETKSRDLLSKIVQLETDRQATELEMSITLSERNKEIEKMRKEMIVKEREWKESLGERRERERVIEIGERRQQELQEKIKGLDMLASELREEVIKNSQAEPPTKLAVREELQDRVQRASELESRLEETQSKESNLRSNNKLLREELRKVQSDVLLSEKRRNPGVGYFASLSQPQQHQQSNPYSTSQQQTQFQPSSYPLSISPSPVGSPRSSHQRFDSIESGGRSPISPLSRSASITSLPISEIDSRAFASRYRRNSVESNGSAVTEGPSVRDREKEREDEAVNFEYLRNVLLEFLEKPAMRPQLIGVMGVILRFTPAEARRLASKVGGV